MNVVAAHKLREEADKWNEAGELGSCFLVDAVDFEPLIIEDDLSTVGRRNGVDAQRQVALVTLHAGRSRKDHRPGPDGAGRGEDVAVDDNRVDQNEIERLTSLAFVR